MDDKKKVEDQKKKSTEHSKTSDDKKKSPEHNKKH